MLLDLNSDFEIDNACCVDEGLKKLVAKQYDIVVSDYEMPQKNGLDFLKELKEQNCQIPFILFTGKGREEVAIQALNLGADGYYNKQGSPETVYGELAHGIRLVISRRNAEEALRASEESYHDLINGMNDTAWVIDFDAKFVEVNDAAVKVLGYSREEFLSMGPSDIDNSLSTEQIQDLVIRMQADQVQVFETTHTTKNGKTIPVEISSSLVSYHGKQAVLSIARNIAERKKAEEAMVQSESHYRLLANNIRDVIWTMDLEGKFTYVSPSAFQLSGYTSDEALKQSIVEVLTPESARKVIEDLQSFRETGTLPSNYYELEQYCKDGSTIWIEVNFTVLRNRDGKPESFLGLSRNITERKKIEKALLESELNYRTIVDRSLQGILITQAPPLRFAFANESMGKMLGYSTQELKSLSPEAIVGLVHSEDRDVFFKRLDARMRGEPAPSSLEFRAVKKNGSIVWLEALANRIEYNGQLAVLGMFLDVTEPKKISEILRESEERYRELANSLPNIIFESDIAGHVEFVNDKALGIAGISNKDLEKGLNIMQFLVPEDRPRAIESMKRLFAGGKSVPDEYTFLRKDGTTFPALILTALRFSQNKLKGLRGIVIDITERKKNEEKLRESFRHNELINEKLHVLGSLTRHDVGNKLMAAKATVYLLKKRIGDNSDLVKYLDHIDSALVSSGKILEFSRLYERIGVEKTSKENVFECFNQALALHIHLSNIKIVNECQGLVVVADSLLKQLFYNFIDNSLKHGEKVTQIRVYYTKDGDGAKLFYEDNGAGISKNNKLRLFELGFSTGKGSGLGLYLVKKMMDVYGWSIVEEGEEGKGAKFRISIPMSSMSI